MASQPTQPEQTSEQTGSVCSEIRRAELRELRAEAMPAQSIAEQSIALQSRAEQSIALQSRAEHCRAEQSIALQSRASTEQSSKFLHRQVDSLKKQSQLSQLEKLSLELQFRQLEKISQIEKAVHFSERRQDIAAVKHSSIAVKRCTSVITERSIAVKQYSSISSEALQ